MSTDSDVTSDLIQTLEDGKDGYAKGAEKLTETNRPDLALIFKGYSDQRAGFAAELHELAQSYGDELRESGSVVGALHRGWMTVKDALAGAEPTGVLDAAEQGEDHAVKAFEEAQQAQLSEPLRTVVERQHIAVRKAHDHVRNLRNAEA